MKEYIIKENPDGTKIYLRDVQLKIYEILCGFDDICKENDIEYCLSYGTALGALRHKGFIPWDDDVDVMMNYENYDKLVKVLSEKLESPFYFHCLETDPLYNATICEMKFRIEGTFLEEKNFLLKNRCEGNGLFLDVFVIDSISASKHVHNAYRGLFALMIAPLVLLDKLGFKAGLLKKLNRKISRHYTKVNRNSGYVGIGPSWVYDGFNDDRLKVESVFPFGELEFENRMFPVPKDTDAYCEVLYGKNYMSFPPIESQKPGHISDIKI